jgi:AcrR family transcriptional regulator
MATRTERTQSVLLQERMKAEREAVYREAINEAAERVFAKKGTAGSRMNEIAAEAGISLGTLYGVIEGKESLFNEIHQIRMREFLACIRAARDAHDDTLASHLAVLREGGRFFLDRPDFLRMCSRDGYGWATRLPSAAGETNLWDEGASVPRALFEKGIAEGLYVADDPDLMVRKMLALKQVELTYWVDTVPDSSDAQVLDRLEDQFIRAFCTRKT